LRIAKGLIPYHPIAKPPYLPHGLSAKEAEAQVSLGGDGWAGNGDFFSCEGLYDGHHGLEVPSFLYVSEDVEKLSEEEDRECDEAPK
jgi:hypothetical protein